MGGKIVLPSCDERRWETAVTGSLSNAAGLQKKGRKTAGRMFPAAPKKTESDPDTTVPANLKTGKQVEQDILYVVSKC